MRKVWWILGVTYAAVGVGAWATDFVTLQDESTVYSVDCQAGQWVGDRCTGHLVAGKRYRFEAVKGRQEVRSWFVSAPERSALYTGCDIRDGRNWSCRYTSANMAKPVTLRLMEGHARQEPVEPSASRHAVNKVRWLLLHWGLPAGNEGDGESLGQAKDPSAPSDGHPWQARMVGSR